jgi:hypothetical protein
MIRYLKPCHLSRNLTFATLGVQLLAKVDEHALVDERYGLGLESFDLLLKPIQFVHSAQVPLPQCGQRLLQLLHLFHRCLAGSIKNVLLLSNRALAAAYMRFNTLVDARHTHACVYHSPWPPY